MKKIKIVLVSDNHYHPETLIEIQKYYHDADYFFHCGDSEMPYALLDGFARVKGNNDYDSQYPDELVLEIGNHRFLLVHGHRQLFLGSFDGLILLAKQKNCDIVCFGHTHRYYEGIKDGIRLLNPGSIWCNRDGTDPSYMIIYLDGDEVTIKKEIYSLPLHESK